MECTVTKAYGQYEMTNVIKYDCIMISNAFKEYNENIKVSGDIYIDGPDFHSFKLVNQKKSFLNPFFMRAELHLAENICLRRFERLTITFNFFYKL